MNTCKSLFWHRRDLRTEDNSGLFKALTNSSSVIPVFIFDKSILESLEKDDVRVSFIHEELIKIKNNYQNNGSDLHIYFGDPLKLIPKLAIEHSCKKVFTNNEYEPYAISRDEKVKGKLSENGIEFIAVKDHVIFEKNEVLKDDGKPYLVFTPYSKKWKSIFTQSSKEIFDITPRINSLCQFENKQPMIALKEIGFAQIKSNIPHPIVSNSTIENYHNKRDFPSENGTSRIGIHLRFGTISIRMLVNQSMNRSETFLNELIWRDFYQMIIYHFPHSAINSFRKEYDLIEWEKDLGLFELWCRGKTGYPLVDAGMRELNQTGHMHNRVRMIVASFLTKHLLLDWRLGESYFASKLLDYELASNVGGWQWAAGCGCDAAPYFRIFNPTTQQQKFDKDMSYIKKWVHEFGTKNYPKPIVEHKFARERALNRFKKGLNK